MKEFLKERIFLFLLLLASDTVSLVALIKANELKGDALTLAIVISLIPSLVISALVKFYLIPRIKKQRLVIIGSVIAVICWIGTIVFYLQFKSVNNEYGKMPFPKNRSLVNPVDSFIVAGCHYTPEAQAEVNDFARRNATLPPSLLFADFNYIVTNVWPEKEIDCARDKILNKFSLMFVFLILGITLTCELIINFNTSDESKSKPAKKKSSTGATKKNS